jgi:lysophospholipase L1-like esterase
MRLFRLLALLPLLLAGCTTAAPAASPPRLRTVVTLGDSVPAGTACGCDPFPTVYARAQHATDVNLAAAGSTATDVRLAVPGSRDVLATAAEVIIMTGANDMAPSFSDPTRYAAVAAEIEADVSASVAAIEQINPVPVIVLGYWNVVHDGRVAAGEYGPDGVQAATDSTNVVNSALEAAAQQSGATYISTFPAFHGTDGRSDPTALLAPDGDHPNAAGHTAIAALLPPLR